MRKSLYEYCLEQGRPELLTQWHSTLNEELTSQSITYGSKKKVWWICECGCEWEASVYTRTSQNTGCPNCAHRKRYGRPLAPRGNDLLSCNPELAASWHPQKNGELKPDQVSVGSHESVWWICKKGHEWCALVKSRTSGAECPVCTNRVVFNGENDLATTHPDLVRQWNPTKNGTLTPQNVVAGTRRKVWWICARGHEWKAAISSRAGMGAGCPVCAGKVVIPGENDLSSTYPGVAAEWHPTKNGPLTPQKVTPYSNRKAWWICPLGHEYSSVISYRTERGNGCPYCSGRKVLKGFNDLETLEPELAKQWHPELNGALTPDKVTRASHKKIWWRCQNDHVWKAVIYSRTRDAKCDCPVCAGKVKESRAQRYQKTLEEC